jgi:hypothetical protein
MVRVKDCYKTIQEYDRLNVERLDLTELQKMNDIALHRTGQRGIPTCKLHATGSYQNKNSLQSISCPILLRNYLQFKYTSWLELQKIINDYYTLGAV